MSDRDLSPEQVQSWLDNLDGQIASLQQQLEPLLSEQARLQDRRTILKELLASWSDSTTDAPGAPAVPVVAGESTKARVHRQAVEIFRSVGHALHSNDLHAEFVRRGFEVPGAGKPNNISVHLTGWDDIVSPSRGTYGLVEHVGEVPPKPRPRTIKRKKARR